MKLRNRLKKVFGVGINDTNYPIHHFTYKTDGAGNLVVDKRIWTCPYYSRWYDMLRRVYSGKFLENRPTYQDCTVCDDWLTFSNFKAWMEQQDWKGKDLDKDFLSETDSKIYSPETCYFIDPRLNQFLKDRKNYRGDLMLGVSKAGDGFQARCSNPFTKEREYLGYFQSEIEAHLAWKNRKHQLAKEWITILEKDGNNGKIIDILKTKYREGSE